MTEPSGDARTFNRATVDYAHKARFVAIAAVSTLGASPFPRSVLQTIESLVAQDGRFALQNKLYGERPASAALFWE